MPLRTPNARRSGQTSHRTASGVGGDSGSSYDRIRSGLRERSVIPRDRSCRRRALGWYHQTYRMQATPPFLQPDAQEVYADVRREILPRLEALTSCRSTAALLADPV